LTLAVYARCGDVLMLFNKENKNAAVTFETMRDLIIELNLPQSILDLYDGKCEREKLQYDFKDPYAIFHCAGEGVDLKKAQERYVVDRYKPILAYGFEKIFAYDIVSKKYVTYSIENFREENLKPMSWDSLFIDIMTLWWESEMPDREIMKLGELLGLKHTKTILEKIEKAHEGGADYNEWQESLIKEIDAIV
jgi:hypothetical protein